MLTKNDIIDSLRENNLIKDIDGKEFVYLYAKYSNIGNTKSTHEATPFPLSNVLLLLMSGNWTLTPNLQDTKVVNNILMDAKKEMTSQLEQKNKEIEELRALLEEKTRYIKHIERINKNIK